MLFASNYSHPRGLIGRYMLRRMDRQHEPLEVWGFDMIGIPQRAKMLDIGCGGGYNIRRMLEMSPESRIYGLDISKESVKLARAVNRKELGRHVKIVHGSVEKTPFKAGILDLVTAFETVIFWPDPEENFKEVCRILKPGGRFAVVINYGEPDANWEEVVPGMTRYTAEEIASFMKGAGFRGIEIFKEKTWFCVIGVKTQAVR